jgi:hypothetical protein
MITRSLTTKFAVALAAAASLLTLPALPQQSQNSQQPPGQIHDGMVGMDMRGMQHGSDQNSDAAKAANDAMSDHDMDMGAHMYMTDLRPPNAADQERAAGVLAALRPAIEKYKDYRVALAEGFQIFLPNVPQPQYHFTNYGYAFEARYEFNPTHPTSLLYKKTKDGYELVGAMYTAPRSATLDDLNARVPLSVARWHEHVNLCFPPKGATFQQVDQKQFGFRGAIATQDACEQAGGRWYPQIFNWMVHVYLYETDPAKIWAH